MISLPWTDVRVEQLTALWLSGLSAAQVAAALGGVSRNAVIGKVHRLGIAGRASASPPGGRSRAHAGRRGAVAASLTPRVARGGRPPPAKRVQPAPKIEVEAPPRISDLTFLSRDTCHWPIGDPAAATFGFCGQPASGAGPYCAVHHRRAYRGAGPRLESDRVLRRLLGGVA